MLVVVLLWLLLLLLLLLSELMLRMLLVGLMMMLMMMMLVVLMMMMIQMMGLNVHELRREASKVFVLLLELHPPVLEPDFDLALGQHKIVRDLDPTSACQVPVIVKFFLQL